MDTVPRTKSEVAPFIAKLGKGKCSAFVAEASTAKVYKVCSPKRNSCSTDCVAVKVPRQKNNPLDAKEAEIQKSITNSILGTPAADHVNRMLAVISTANGPAIITNYEQPKAAATRDLADLLIKADITDQLWRSINFQFIKTIYSIQQSIPGFTHNDTHTKNILLVPNTTNHVCSVTSPRGKVLSDSSTVLIRIIDFGQVLANDKTLQSPDGIEFWKKDLFGNKMIDFQRFAVNVVVDVYESVETKRVKEPPSWFTTWVQFVERWLDPKFLVVDDESGTAFNEPSNALAPSKKGTTWLQKYYGPKTNKGIGNMLDDEYFSDFVISTTSFETDAKLRTSKRRK